MLGYMASIRPMHTDIEHSTTEAFFQRGREIAQLAGRGCKLQARHTVTFEDLGEMAGLLVPRRVALFIAVNERVGTIAEVAARLGRSTRAVSRDVAFFAKLGIFTIESSPDGPQGIYREVRSVADKLVLTCVIDRSVGSS